MSEHDDMSHLDEQRDELLGVGLRSLDTPEHADGFFAGLDARLDEVDAERDTVRVPRWFTSRRWVAYGSALAAAAALIVAGFLVAGGPQKSGTRTGGTETLATASAPQAAPMNSADAAGESAAAKGGFGDSSSPMGSMRSGLNFGGRPSQLPRTLPDLATASDLLGMTVHSLKDARTGGVALIAIGEVPATNAAGEAITHREVFITYKEGLQLIVSRTRLVERPEGSGTWVEMRTPEDYEDIWSRAAASSMMPAVMPEPATVAGHAGLAEEDTTPQGPGQTGPRPLSVRWHDANGFYTLGFIDEADHGLSVDDLIAIAASMY